MQKGICPFFYCFLKMNFWIKCKTLWVSKVYALSFDRGQSRKQVSRLI